MLQSRVISEASFTFVSVREFMSIVISSEREVFPFMTTEMYVATTGTSNTVILSYNYYLRSSLDTALSIIKQNLLLS